MNKSVPQGWIKGEKLVVVRPDHNPKHGLGMVRVADSLSRAGNGDAVPALYFTGEDELDDWLDWWDGSPADPQPPVPLPDPE